MSATIKNGQGIHCRPSAVIVRELQDYGGAITVRGEAGDCDPRSIMGLLALGLQVGASVSILITGPDEEAIGRKVVELFEREYDFPPRKPGEQPMVMREDGTPLL